MDYKVLINDPYVRFLIFAVLVLACMGILYIFSAK
jgi:Flp pilus assembly protein TadB